MAVQKIPSSSVNGPDGATRQVFGGYSSTGTYIYSSPLPAGNYIAQIRYTTSRSISTVTSNRWFPEFTLSGSINGSLLTNMAPGNIHYNPNTNQYTEHRDGNYYFNLAQTESALTIAGGYTVTLGTTVTTWTTTGGNLDFAAMPKPDITSMAMTSRNIYILGLTDKEINTYHFPTGVAITFDSGLTWNNTSTGSNYQYYDLFPFTSSGLSQGYTNVARWSTQLMDARNLGNQVHIAKGRYLSPIGINIDNQYKVLSMKNIGIYDVSGLTFTSTSSVNNIVAITGGDNGSRYLAVGGYNSGQDPYLASSNDGIGWVSRCDTTTTMLLPSGSTLASAVISAVVSNQQRHIVTSSHSSTASVIAFTTNFTTWTTRTNPTSATIFNYGTFVTSKFYLMGNSDRIAISTDGLTWTSSGTMSSNNKYTMAYSSTPTNKYVIGMESGVIVTSTDGNTWTSRTSNMNTRITGIAYGAGVYVAGGFGGHLRYSTDGVTWATSATSYVSTSRSIVGVGYGPEGFLAAVSDNNSTNPTLYFESTNGITWTSTREYDYYYNASYSAWHSNRETRVSGYYGNNYYFMTPLNGFNRNLTDSLLQTSTTNFSTNCWYTTSPVRSDSNGPIGITYFPNDPNGENYILWGQTHYNGGNGQTAYNAQRMASSTFNRTDQGIQMIYGPNGDMPTVREVAWSNQAGYAIAVGDFGRIAKATTSSSWTQVTTSGFDFDDIHALTYGDGIWLAGGDNGKMSRSTDGTTWSTVTSGFGTSTIWALSHNASVFIAGGGGGYLATSTDGITWTSRTSNMGGKDIYVMTPSAYLTDFVPDVWMIAGQDSAAAVSTDGITWTTRNVTPPSIVEIQDAVQTDTNYVGLVGYTKSITAGGVWYPIRSTDGLTWTVPTIRATTTSYWQPRDSTYNADGLSEIIWTTGGNLFAVDTGGNGSSRSTGQGQYSRYSTDGVTWDVIEIAPLTGVTRAQRAQMVSSQYIAWATVGGGNALIARSPSNAQSWSTVANPFPSSVNPWYWGAGNGFYLVSGGVVGKLYKTTNFSSYSLILFGGTSNSVMAYDSTKSRWVLVGSDGKSFYASSTGVTWTQFGKHHTDLYAHNCRKIERSFLRNTSSSTQLINWT